MKKRPSTILSTIIGFLIVFLISTAQIWLEFFHRLVWAINGGSGEAAYWGEPLFYILLIGVPYGLGGALFGWLVGVIVFRGQ